MHEREKRFRLLVEGMKDHAIYMLDPEGRVVSWNQGARRIKGYREGEILGRHFSVFYPKEDTERSKPEHELRVAEAEGRYEGDGWRVRKDGSRLWTSTIITALRDEKGNLHGFSKVTRDTNGHKRAEEELRARACQKEKAVADLVRRALASTDPSALIGEAVDLIAKVLEVEYCKVLKLLPDGKELLLQAGVGWNEGLVGQATVGAGLDSQAGYTLISDEPVIVEDLRSETRFSGPPLLHEHRVVSGMSVILGGQERPFGVLGAHTKERRTFTKDDVNFFQAVANVLATATERKRAEEELKESEERFRATFEQTAVGMAHNGLDGRWLRINQRLCDIVGYTREELLQKTFQDITHPDDLEADLRYGRQLLAGEIGTFSTEKRYIKKDGSTVWVNLTVSLTRDLSGDLSYFVTVIEDIDERKRAEKALRRSEERYRTFIEQSAEGVWRLELGCPLSTRAPEDEQIEHFYRHGYLAECNDTTARMYGFARAEEMAGAKLDDLLPHSVPDNVECLRAFVRSGYQLTNAELHEVDYRGNAKHFLNNLTGIIEDGFVVRVWGTQRDISERRKVEAALHQSEELYRTVVEQAAENIFLVDAKTKRIIEANAALHRSLGYAPEELRRLTLYDIVAQDRQSIDQNTQRILEEGRLFVGERKYRRKDGSLVDVEVSVSATPYEGRVAMCIVAHDVTERKRAEDMLHRSLNSLLALHEAGHVLGSTLEGEEIAARLLRIMQLVFKLTTAVISRPDEHGQMRVWHAVGLENLQSKARHTPEVQTVLRTVLETGEHRLFRLERSKGNSEVLMGLCLPLRMQKRAIGLLEAYGPDAMLEEDTLEVLGSMTAQAASALENAQLYEELAEREKRLENVIGKLLAAQEEERRRIAYEVHDSLAQVAVAAHQHLQAYSRRYPPETERSRRDLERVLRLVRRTVSDARKIIANLRPTALDDLGLVAAVSLEVEGLREEGYQVAYEKRLGEERLPAAVEIALFRIVQEALTNLRKHAQTRKVRIELRCRGKDVCLEVKDYGRGFDPSAVAARSGPGERVGLAGMRERVGMLGGEFEIRSRPGAGTSVIATVPVLAVVEED